MSSGERSNEKEVKTISRKKSVIQTHYSASREYLVSVKGNRNDTKELNINIKTINCAFLRMLKSQHELSPHQETITEKYFRMEPNFQSLKFLGLPPQQQPDPAMREARKGLRALLFEFYSSDEILRRIIGSTRMRYKSKIIMIKFLSKMVQKVLGGPAQKGGWKETIKLD